MRIRFKIMTTWLAIGGLLGYFVLHPIVMITGHIMLESGLIHNQGINNSEVVQYLIFNQGYAWPGGKKPRIRAATSSKTVNATDLMWDFFKKHPKKQI